ncbi:MAG TPA: hypothetical protein VLC48_11140, partial [Gemmatimonadota bacterium]|nr:hypothetical protein [Gemmatimonadota bacterium]
MSGMLTRRLTLCAGLVMLGAGSASGQPVVKEYLNYCRTGSLRPCASVRIETEYNASGGTDVRISVQNLGWYGGADDGPLALYQVEIEGRNSSAFSGSASDVSVSTLGGATTGGTFDPSDDRW